MYLRCARAADSSVHFTERKSNYCETQPERRRHADALDSVGYSLQAGLAAGWFAYGLLRQQVLGDCAVQVLDLLDLSGVLFSCLLYRRAVPPAVSRWTAWRRRPLPLSQNPAG